MRMFLRMKCENFVLAAEFPCEWKFATKFASDCECDGVVHSDNAPFQEGLWKPCPYWKPLQAPSNNPSKKHLPRPSKTFTYCREQIIADPEKCFQELVSEKLQIVLRERPRLELIIVSSNFQALLFWQDKLRESIWKLFIPVTKSSKLLDPPLSGINSVIISARTVHRKIPGEFIFGPLHNFHVIHCASRNYIWKAGTCV